MEQLLASSRFQEVYQTDSPWFPCHHAQQDPRGRTTSPKRRISHCTCRSNRSMRRSPLTQRARSETPVHPDSDNPRYCAETFLFTSTLARGEEALFLPVATHKSYVTPNTSDLSQLTLDVQPADDRLGAMVGIPGDSADIDEIYDEDLCTKSTKYRRVTFDQDTLRTSQDRSTPGELLNFNAKLLTFRTTVAMSQSPSDAPIKLMCVDNMVAHSGPASSAELGHEKVSGILTGDLEHDLGILVQAPYEL